MQPSKRATVRPYLKRAIQDIDIFLNGLREWENVERKFVELYRRMEAGDIPPEVKGQGRPVRLTEEQQEAFFHGTHCGKPLTDEEREAVLAGWHGEPISDRERATQQFALRGGWQKSSRQAAVWLRNVEETSQADGIDAELSRLPTEPMDAADLQDCRDAEREAAEQVKAILTACLKEQAALVGDPTLLPARPEQNEWNGGNLIERLLAGTDDVELTPRELALLEAHLKQPVSLSSIQRGRQATGSSGTSEKRNKLTLIWDFNRNLQAAQSADRPTPPTALATTVPKKRGRKKADYQTVQREAQLAADWEQARDAGTYKGDFARDKGMKLADLDKLLDRVAARKKPSE